MQKENPYVEKVAVLAITKNGIKIGLKLKAIFPSWKIFAPSKFSNNDSKINWFTESTSVKIEDLFKTNDALICLFSLGAVVRLLSTHVQDKKTDPAIIVIDDKMNFVISVLSGHLGGANELTKEIAEKLKSIAVITTAADVNKTIAVDLVGKKFDWEIDDDSAVTKVSAYMVNEEKIGIFQESGEKNWWEEKFPKNVTFYKSLEELKNSESKGYLIISDKTFETDNNMVIYRPKSLVVGIGLHWDTTKDTIRKGLDVCLKQFHFSPKSIKKIVSIKKSKDAKGLVEFANQMKVPLEYIEKQELAKIEIPNPSDVVKSFEGTPSVSEAAAIMASKGKLVVEKQKFPPNLTIAIARISY